MTDNAGVTAEHCVLGRKMGVASKLRKSSRAGRLTFSAENPRNLNLLLRSGKMGRRGKLAAFAEATPKAFASGRRAKEVRRKK
jgi:hypothetical protein